MTLPECPELAAFARGELDAASFPHREHVRMAFEMLRRHDFVTTVQRFSQALRLMSSKAGRPQAFNQTVTIAFLSLIAECLEGAGDFADFAAFLDAHPQLLDKRVLARWYSHERLTCETARRSFLLPDPVR
jgi:hypothetical protein